MEQRWENSGTFDGGRVEQRWWNSVTEMVKQCNRDGGSVEQRWWNSGISDGGTVEHVTVEK